MNGLNINYNKVWKHIFENKPFYTHLALLGNFKIFEESRVYHDLTFNKWGADPVSFIIQCLRKHDVNIGGDMPKDEYSFIRKYLLRRGIVIPFTKMEYSEYLLSIARSSTLITALEDGVFSDDNTFIIPSQAASKKFFGVAHEYISNLSSDLFLYIGSRARCIVDIYDSIVGFEVYTDGGHVFIPMYGTAKNSAYFRPEIKRVNRDSTLTIFEDHGRMILPSHNAFVSIPVGSVSSVENISQYFHSFNIDSDNNDFILDVSVEISKTRDIVNITVNGEITIAEYLAKFLIAFAEKYTISTYNKVFKTAMKMSALTNIDRDLIISLLNSSPYAKYLSLIISMLGISRDRLSPKIREMILGSSLMMVSRQPSIGGDGGSVKIFNTLGGYFKDIPMDSRLLMKNMITELGGFSFIERYCNVVAETIPSRFKTIESFISASVASLMQEQYSILPPFRGMLGLGMHYVNDQPVFNGGKEVYGLNGKRSIDGVAFQYEDVEFSTPLTKPKIREMSRFIVDFQELSASFFQIDNNEADMFAILVASTIIAPLLCNSSQLFLNITSENHYVEIEMKSKIFNGIFRAVSIRDVNKARKILSSVEDSGTVPNIFSVDKKDMLVFKRNVPIHKSREVVLGEQVGSLSSFGTCPLIVFSEESLRIRKLLSFEFQSHGKMNHSRVTIPKDISALMVVYAIRTTKVFRRMEEDLIKYRNKKSAELPMHLVDEYVEFFSKIIAGMMLCEHLDIGYTPSEFHDLMYAKHFAESTISESPLKSAILELPLSKGTIYEKIKDKIYRMDTTDDKIAFVDKVFHIRYVKKDNTRISVVIFNTRIMHDKIKDIIGLSYVDFLAELAKTQGYISSTAATKSYRIGRNKDKTIMQQYVEIHGKDREEFGAMRYNEMTDL
jgi:hypothetical protein